MKSDEGAGVVFDRARDLDAIPHAAGNAHDQRSQNHGTLGEYQSLKCIGWVTTGAIFTSAIGVFVRWLM